MVPAVIDDADRITGIVIAKNFRDMGYFMVISSKLKLERRFDGEKVLVITPDSDFFPPLKAVFDLGQQVLAPVIAEAQTQTPKLLSQSAGEDVVIGVSLAGYGIT